MILLNSQLQQHIHQIQQHEEEDDVAIHDDKLSNTNTSAEDFVKEEFQTNNIDETYCKQHISCNDAHNMKKCGKVSNNRNNVDNTLDDNATRRSNFSLQSSCNFIVPLVIGYFFSYILHHPIIVVCYENDFILYIFCRIIITGIIGITFSLVMSRARKKYSDVMQERYIQEIQKYRHNIQRNLGSIHAPYMLNNRNFEQLPPTIYNKYDVLIQSKMTKFTENHIALLSTIDQSIQLLQIATSLQLGLGPWSLSTNRVEMNTTFKGRNDICNATNHPSPINLKYQREMIFNILLKQSNSILDIRRNFLTLMQNKNKCINSYTIFSRDNDDNDKLLHGMNQELLNDSKLLTITFMKSVTVHVRNLLSETLSLCMNNTFLVSSEMDSKTDDFVQSILLSSSYIKELHLYVNASLFGLDTIHEKGKTFIKDTVPWKQLSKLQKHIDGVVASFWAYNHSIYLENSNERKMFWNKFGEELQNITSLYDLMNNLYYSDDVDSNISNVTNDIESTENGNEVVCESKEKQEYNDKGKDNLISSSEIDSLPKDKILIFSGNGAKKTQNHTQKQKRKTAMEKDVTVASYNRLDFLARSTSIDQSILLKELQSRLQSLEKVEEWDAMNNQYSRELSIPNTNISVKEVSNNNTGNSSTFFLGASGSLLSELKVALSNKDPVVTEK